MKITHSILFLLLSLSIYSQSIFEQSIDINYDDDGYSNLTLRNLEGFPSIRFKSTTDYFDGVQLYYADYINRFVIYDEESAGFGLRIKDRTSEINIDPGSIGRNSIPARNSLYGNTIIKGWANVKSEDLKDGVNLSMSVLDMGAYQFTFLTPMTNNHYAAVVTGSITDFTILNQTNTGFLVYTNSGSTTLNYSVIVVGDN